MRSDFFYYYRLFLLGDYQEDRKDYELNFKRGTVDPNKAYITPKKLTENFKSLINRLIRHMENTNHTPGQRIISQNDDIFDFSEEDNEV